MKVERNVLKSLILGVYHINLQVVYILYNFYSKIIYTHQFFFKFILFCSSTLTASVV
jgi:hypothetical protein